MRVLIVDDEPSFRGLAGRALADVGYEVAVVNTLADARHYDRAGWPDVVLLDRCLPDGDGVDFLRSRGAEATRAAAVLMVTAYGNVQNAVDALKLGAADYLLKPVALAQLVAKLRQLERERERARPRAPVAGAGAGAAGSRHGVANLVDRSAARRAALAQLRQVSRSPTTPVLIHGPSGSGKQVMAEVLHELTYGAGAVAPFVEVNCATLREGTMHAQLFGRHGDDAAQMRPGLLAEADGGTLFLDHISQMPGALQAALLKFLDQMRFRRLGGGPEVAVRLRLVAATSENVAEAVARKALRADLVHRLAVFVLPLTRLIDCPEDVQPLATHFVGQFAARLGRPAPQLASSALQTLAGYAFPGNARELRNIMERAVLLAEDGPIEASHVVLPQLAAETRAPGFFTLPGNAPLPLQQVERLYVKEVLRHFGGKRTLAAESLGISYPTFLKRLRELGAATDA